MDPFLSLANRTYEIVVSHVTCLSNWGFYLFNSEFDGEPELRNKIGTIWICSLLDTLEAEHRFLPEIEKEALANGWQILAYNARWLTGFGAITSELLGSLSREEQIFLGDFRNQLVHSYLAGRHKKFITVKHCEEGRLVSERLADIEYQALIRSFHEPPRSMDQIIQPMISKLIDRGTSHSYWDALGALQRNSEAIYLALREDRPIDTVF
jgi:hypothetical protein